MSEAPTTPTEAPAVTPADQLYPVAPEAKPETPASEEKPAEPAEEAKPEETPGEEKPEGEAEATPLELKMPEGVELDSTLVDGYRELAAKANLPPAVAQEVFDFGVKLLQEQADSVTKAWETTIEGWQAELDKDPELGGDKKSAAQATIGRALDEYGTPEIRQAFEDTGAGWNPAITRFVHNMAKALSEGTTVPATRPAARPMRGDPAVLYGDQT